MTETASHIALKNLTEGEKTFQTLGDIQIDLDQRHCLRLCGTLTHNNWIQTNDIVELISADRFRWLGRADFVINSGGVKIHPEIIEAELSNQLKIPFFVAGIPDKEFGQKVILVVESQEYPQIDWSKIERYQRPKETYALPQFEWTESGKINRKATLLKLDYEN